MIDSNFMKTSLKAFTFLDTFKHHYFSKGTIKNTTNGTFRDVKRTRICKNLVRNLVQMQDTMFSQKSNPFILQRTYYKL